MRLWAHRTGIGVVAALLLWGQVQSPAAQADIFTILRDIGAAVDAAQDRPVQVIQQAPSRADPDLVSIQQRLNALGFDAGPADGVMGTKTRRAVADYQRSIGRNPTGQLDASDRATLFGQQSSVAQTSPVPPANAGSSFSLLYDVDLPYNDFRSGMSEPGLRDIGIDGCMAACSADGRCQAFTYNLQAGICFLKSEGANPTPFTGAASGLRNGAAAATMATRPLTPSEVARLQAGLNARGYDAGEADGVAGARTRAAIARFAADNPSVGGAGMTLGLMQAVLLPPGEAAAPVPSMDAAAYPGFEEIDHVLALIAINHDPTVLDDRGLLVRWFQREHPSRAEQARIDFEAANSVQQDAILDALRVRLIADAKALTADPALLPIRVRAWTPIQFNEFQPGKGIAVWTGGGGVSRSLGYRSNAVSREFVGVALDAPEIAFIPIVDAVEASAFLDRARGPNGNGNAELVTWFTITEIGADRNLVGASAARRDQIPMTVKLDKVSVATMRFGPDRKSGGEELYVLRSPDAPEPAPGPGSDGVLVAQQMGLPIIDGHVLVPADAGLSYEINSSFGVENFDFNMWRYYMLASLRVDPERAKDKVDDATIRKLLSPSQHLRVYGIESGVFLGFQNEFERRRAARVYNEEVVPELLLGAPALPVPVVSVFRIQVGEYDFASSSFPLGSGNGQGLFALPENLKSSLIYRDLPAALPMGEAAAEQFILSAQNSGRPWVWVAVFGELSLAPTEIVEERPVNRVIFTPTRAGIYAEPFLTTQLAEIDPAISVFDPNAAKVAPSVPTADESTLASIVPATEFDLLARAYAALSPRGQTEPMIASSEAVRRANEFDLAAARGDAEAALIKAQPPESVWLNGTIDVGTYDLAAGTFAMEGLDLARPPSNSGYAANINFTIADPRPLYAIAVPEDLARQVAESGQRRLSLLLRVDILDVTLEGTEGTPTYRFAVDLAEAVVWSRLGGEDRPPVVLARLDVAPDKAIAADVPPVTLLDQEGIDYVRLKYAPDTFGEPDFIRMMGARWALEQARLTTDGTNFFPPGTDLTAPGIRERWLPDFIAWAKARAGAMGEPLTLRVGREGFACVEWIVGEYWKSPLHDAMIAAYPEIATSRDLIRVASQFTAAHETGPVALEVRGYLLEDPGCNMYISTQTMEQFGWTGAARSGAVIMLDTIALPGTAVATPERVELSIAIESVDVIEVAGSAPALAIRAKFAGAQVGDAYHSAEMTLADLEAVRVALAAPTEMPDNWDIVGLQPGLPLDKAEALIRDHMDVAAVFTRKPGVRTSPHFANERVFVSADLREAIGLVYLAGPDGDIVYVISREVAQPAGTMAGTVLDSLRAKYGPEQKADVSPDRFSAIWVSQQTPRSSTQGQYCTAASPSAWEHWVLVEGDVDGIDPGVIDYLQVRGYPWLPGPRDIGQEILDYARLDCGVTIDASKHLSGNSDVLNVQIIDFEGYAKAFDAAKNLVDETKVEPPRLNFSL